ncbi:hypothetical protein SSUR61_1675 [Streptococcus suis R61]|uniref:Uncharacterized protein n=1 Tax=Streptococcus suis R61 TaxID=996306 RepID=A0AA87F7U8_STRSU|nr:hypothetical protein SSUR61_1675 [Streptococcus suis R61]
MKVGDETNEVRVSKPKVELRSSLVLREQAIKLHWSFTLITSSQQRLFPSQGKVFSLLLVLGNELQAVLKYAKAS